MLLARSRSLARSLARCLSRSLALSVCLSLSSLFHTLSLLSLSLPPSLTHSLNLPLSRIATRKEEQHTYALIARHLCDRARERMRPWSRRYQCSRKGGRGGERERERRERESEDLHPDLRNVVGVDGMDEDIASSKVAVQYRHLVYHFHRLLSSHASLSLPAVGVCVCHERA